MDRDHIQRVLTGIQATYAGAIAQMRFTFGAQPDLKARYGVQAVKAYRMDQRAGAAGVKSFDPGQESSPAVLQFCRELPELPPVV